MLTRCHPAPVAATAIRGALGEAILEPPSGSADDLEHLNLLEEELGRPLTTELVLGTKAEVRARIGTMYVLLTAQGLRQLQPEPGDIVEGGPPYDRWQREVSSIGEQGRVYCRGVPPRSAWPNRLVKVTSVGEANHPELQRRVRSEQLNNPLRFGANFDAFRDIEAFAVAGHAPGPEAIRELEELLEVETDERPFQQLIERYPQLLSAVVAGNWRTYVIPQQHLGNQFVPDFLVLGVNSAGPQWVTVEIEAPGHRLHLRGGGHTGSVRHAIGQIDTWREWLTENVDFAQRPRRRNGLGLHGLTNRAAGLVIIGRSQPTADRDAARNTTARQNRIEIHTYDWLLRHARNMMHDPRQVSEFAWAGVDERLGRDPEIATLEE